jgi:hypothetical protein
LATLDAAMRVGVMLLLMFGGIYGAEIRRNQGHALTRVLGGHVRHVGAGDAEPKRQARQSQGANRLALRFQEKLCINVSDLVDAAVAAGDKQTKAIIDGVFKSLTQAAVKGEEISITGFDKFKV